MSTDNDLQRRFDSAKTVLDLESGSAAEVKGRAIRRTRRTRVLTGSAVVFVVVLLGALTLTQRSTDVQQELVTAAPTNEDVAIDEAITTAPASSVIFETNFQQDTGYAVGFTNLWNGDGAVPPSGWDGVIVGSLDGEFAVVGGEGLDGSNALRISWGDRSQPVLSLGKHLTGDEATGYDELYVRYRVRLPNSFTFGAGDGRLGTWSWGRLWQNTSVTPDGPNAWTENRANAGYVGYSFNNGIPFTSASAVWAENTGEGLELGGSAGPHQRVDWFVSGSDPGTQPGYFERLWDINTTDRPGQLEDNTSQDWHTVEFRFRLAATATSDDAIFEVFFDGEPQGPPTVIAAAGGAPDRVGIPTTNIGSGFNFLTFFGNVQLWNEQWGTPGVEGHVWVNDVVVSTERIGPDYSPGD